MQRLVLLAVGPHLFKKNTACAYVCYGDKETRLDHQKNRIVLYSDSHLIDYMEHLRLHVLEELHQELTSYGYKAIDIDLGIKGRFPYIVIQREDETLLENKEMQHITRAVEKSLMRMNEKKKLLHDIEETSESMARITMKTR